MVLIRLKFIFWVLKKSFMYLNVGSLSYKPNIEVFWIHLKLCRLFSFFFHPRQYMPPYFYVHGWLHCEAQWFFHLESFIYLLLNLCFFFVHNLKSRNLLGKARNLQNGHFQMWSWNRTPTSDNVKTSPIASFGPENTVTQENKSVRKFLGVPGAKLGKHAFSKRMM